jgi:hypothetical protein
MAGRVYLSPPNSTTLSGFFFSSPNGRAMFRQRVVQCGYHVAGRKMPSDGESSVRMAFSARRGCEVSWLWLSSLGRDLLAAVFPADRLASGKQSDSQIRLRLPSDAAAAVSVRQQ